MSNLTLTMKVDQVAMLAAGFDVVSSLSANKAIVIRRRRIYMAGGDGV